MPDRPVATSVCMAERIPSAVDMRPAWCIIAPSLQTGSAKQQPWHAQNSFCSIYSDGEIFKSAMAMASQHRHAAPSGTAGAGLDEAITPVSTGAEAPHLFLVQTAPRTPTPGWPSKRICKLLVPGSCAAFDRNMGSCFHRIKTHCKAPVATFPTLHSRLIRTTYGTRITWKHIMDLGRGSDRHATRNRLAVPDLLAPKGGLQLLT